jgi:tripartite-type tricarboxylate transporter receptor subunit TctC
VPPAVVERLNRELNEIVATPEIKERRLELGLQAYAGNPEELRSPSRADIKKWAKVIAVARSRSRRRSAIGRNP